MPMSVHANTWIVTAVVLADTALRDGPQDLRLFVLLPQRYH